MMLKSAGKRLTSLTATVRVCVLKITYNYFRIYSRLLKYIKMGQRGVLIVILTETWLDKFTPSSLFVCAKSFNVFRKDRLSRGLGDVYKRQDVLSQIQTWRILQLP